MKKPGGDYSEAVGAMEDAREEEPAWRARLQEEWAEGLSACSRPSLPAASCATAGTARAAGGLRVLLHLGVPHVQCVSFRL